MKILITSLTSILFLISFNTAAQERGFYVGGSLGYVDLGEDAANVQADFEDDDTFTDISLTGEVDDTGLGWKLFGGYNINEYLGVEAGYVDLGKATADLTFTATAPDLSPDPISVTVTGEVDVSGFTLNGIGSYPLHERFDVFAKGGVFIWNADGRFTATITGFGSETLEEDDDGTDIMFGLGARFHLNDNVSFRAEWERFNSISEDKNNVDLLSIGIQYNF